MDASILQPLALIAVAIAIVVTLYEMSQSLRPATCLECGHCKAIAEQQAQTQERLTREYARRVGLDDSVGPEGSVGLEDNDDDRRS